MVAFAPVAEPSAPPLAGWPEQSRRLPASPGVRSPRYIDAPILRDEDKNSDGDCTDAATGIQGSNSGDEHLYYCQDGNYNTTSLVDSYDGAVVERYMYDPYGKVTVLHGVRDSSGTSTTEWDARTSNTFANEILYCGYRHDSETGLYHVRNRMYHPTLGRWVTRDPSEYGDGMGLYLYVGARPLRWVDPLGLWRDCTEQEKKEIKVPGKWEKTSGSDAIAEALGWTIYRVPGGEARGHQRLQEINLGEDIPAWQRPSWKVHEVVGGPVAKRLAGWGEGPAPDMPFVAMHPGGEMLNLPVSGWHNLALDMELGALAAEHPERCTCDYAKARYGTAHVGPPGRERVNWENVIKEAVEFICRCENGEKEGKSHSWSACYAVDRWGGFDREIFDLGLSLKCESCRIVSGSYYLDHYD